MVVSRALSLIRAEVSPKYITGEDLHPRLVQAFIALQIIGGSVFILVVLSALVAQRRGGSRHITFFSFCFSWIVFCLSYSLLSFAGQQLALPGPDHGLCLVQSAFVYAAPPL